MLRPTLMDQKVWQWKMNYLKFSYLIIAMLFHLIWTTLTRRQWHKVYMHNILVGTFLMSEDKIRAFMEKHKYEEEIAGHFFWGGKDSPDVFSKETKRLVDPNASWLNNSDECVNVWSVFKDFLKAVGNRNEERDKYQRLSISQIILFISIIGMRKRTVKALYH